MKKRTKGKEVIRWIETHCVHTQGRWLGRPFRLLPWQKRILLQLFEIEDDGFRRYQWALIGVPKKNGKTELAAALALYFLIGDGEPSPLIVCAAAAEDQADLVFGAAKIMCEHSPTLKQITEGGRFDKEIVVPSIPGARLRRVAAAAGTNDGQNIHVVICDELHEWVQPKHEQTWNVLTNAFGAREQPMVLQITTAGFDKESICGREYERGVAVQEGKSEDRSFFFFWQQAPEGCDYKDPEMWRAANPSYGHIVFERSFRLQLTKKPESVFRRYFLNQWTESAVAWITGTEWDACFAPERALRPDLPIHVGIDVGVKHDSSAVVAAQRQEDRVVARAWVWENPHPVEHSQHDEWKMDISLVEALCRRLREQFPEPAAEVDEEVMDGPAFWYDPHFFERSAQMLDDEGLTMIGFPQFDSLMVPASQTLFRLVKNQQLAHDGNLDLRAHVMNAIAKTTRRGFRIERPPGRRKHIDAATALCMAAWKAETTPIPDSDDDAAAFVTM